MVASGCVFNNYIDRDIDRKMERTKNRVLVKGLISPEASLVYATLLGIAGFMLLWFGANPLACWLGVMGFVVYVGVYSLYMKRHSVYGTLIGSLSGAAPPVIGYCAVTGDFDSGAAILLAIFSLWQMPHSYAIAIFRFKDYQAANIPVLPVVKGISVAKNHITLYIVAFAVATLMLSLAATPGINTWSWRQRSASGGWAWRCVAIKWPMIKSGRVSCSSFLSSPSPRCP